MLCKVVYFDEDSVTDFVQIVAGGQLEKTTELLNQSQDKGEADISGNVFQFQRNGKKYSKKYNINRFYRFSK